MNFFIIIVITFNLVIKFDYFVKAVYFLPFFLEFNNLMVKKRKIIDGIRCSIEQEENKIWSIKGGVGAEATIEYKKFRGIILIHNHLYSCICNSLDYSSYDFYLPLMHSICFVYISMFIVLIYV